MYCSSLKSGWSASEHWLQLQITIIKLSRWVVLVELLIDIDMPTWSFKVSPFVQLNYNFTHVVFHARFLTPTVITASLDLARNIALKTTQNFSTTYIEPF